MSAIATATKLRITRSTAPVSRTNTPLTLLHASDLFIRSRKIDGFTVNTVKHYTKTFDRLAHWLDGTVGTVQEIDHNVIRDFVSDLQTEGLSPRTIYGYQQDLKAFFYWLLAEGEIAKHPYGEGKNKLVRMIKVPTWEPDYFTQQEFEALDKTCNGLSAIAIRNRALIWFLLSTGLRLEENVSVLVGQIDLSEGRVRNIMGKGQKARSVNLSPLAVKHLRKYLSLHPDATNPQAKLWFSSQGEMTYHGMSTVVQKLGRATTYTADGVKHPVKSNPHKFRRTFAINYLRAGGDIFTLSKLMGHADIQVLRHYLGHVEADLTAAFTRFDPTAFRKRA